MPIPVAAIAAIAIPVAEYAVGEAIRRLKEKASVEITEEQQDIIRRASTYYAKLAIQHPAGDISDEHVAREKAIIAATLLSLAQAAEADVERFLLEAIKARLLSGIDLLQKDVA